ncbi:MAG: hypothetical protein GY807_21135 [Gammaproteobacteria bacterium]|nr:hypothetical protein [Gammaproteobacteria bacterium]
MNRVVFFDSVRASLFKGKLTAKQVSGMEFILDQWNETGFTDIRWLAYALATAFHETARTMQPIREYGRGRGKKYGRKDPITGQVYYGRGYVQLTWKSNYKTASQALGIDFVRNPDLVMDPNNAAFIMFQGMKDSWFTGKGFADYIKPDRRDYYNARRIINGIDKARTISNYAIKFETAIAAQMAVPGEPKPVPAPTPPEQPQHWAVSLLLAILDVLKGVFRK